MTLGDRESEGATRHRMLSLGREETIRCGILGPSCNHEAIAKSKHKLTLQETPLRHTQVLSSLAHWICTPLSPDNRCQEQSVSSERVYVAPSPL